MNSNVEELLAQELRRQADNTRWQPELLRGALQRHRRRRIRRRVALPVLAAGVAAAATVSVAVAVVAPPLSTPAVRPTIETVAYVLSRAKSAVTAARADVLEVRSQPRDGWSVTSWIAPNNGVVRLDTYLVPGGHTAFYAEPAKTVIVDYQTKSWWSVKPDWLVRGLSPTRRQLAQYRHDLRLIPGLLAFQLNAWDNGDPKLTIPTPAVIRSELADGKFRLIETQTSGGQRLLELRGTDSNAGVAAHYRALTIWVNAATYLPVRSVAAGLGSRPLVSEFAWLAPTAANLALLKPTIPAGFRYEAPHCPCG
jgi:hypothetical protein